MELEDYVRTAIKICDGSQSELARRMSQHTETKITQRHVSNWLCGLNGISLEKAVALELAVDSAITIEQLKPCLTPILEGAHIEAGRRSKSLNCDVTSPEHDNGIHVSLLLNQKFCAAQQMLLTGEKEKAKDVLLDLAGLSLLAVDKINGCSRLKLN